LTEKFAFTIDVSIGATQLVCRLPVRHIFFINAVVFLPGGYSWKILVGVCRPALQILTLFQTNNYKANVREYSLGILFVKKMNTISY